MKRLIILAALVVATAASWAQKPTSETRTKKAFSASYASDCLDVHDYKGAVRYCNPWTKKDTISSPWFYLGMAQFNLHDYQQAESSFQMAFRYETDWFNAAPKLYWISKCKMQMGQKEEALSFAQQARRRTHDSIVILWLGECYMALGDTASAYDTIRFLQPFQPNQHIRGTMDIVAQVYLGDTVGALAEADNLSESMKHASYAAACVYSMVGDTTRALEVLKVRIGKGRGIGLIETEPSLRNVLQTQGWKQLAETTRKNGRGAARKIERKKR